MARPREFERSAAVEQAMQVFWEHGYDRASTARLERRMGIGRSSLYAAFGSKDQLYAEAMERYVADLRQRVIARLAAEGPAARILRGFFHAVARRGESGSQPLRTCMVVRASLDGAAAPARVRGLVAGALEELDAAFLALLERGRQDGTIVSRAPLAEQARLLTTTFQGMNIAAGAGRDHHTLLGIVRSALVAVGCPSEDA